MEHHELEKYIPHRSPFLLVDRIIEIESGERAVGIKNVTGTENFFPGHFPGQPVMPGVLIIEALAQTAAVLAMYSSEKDQGKLVYFAAIDNARFKRLVRPGDTLRLEVDVEKARSRMWKVKARALVEGEPVCEADLTAMVTDRG
ncbi:MAG: 3-hydroxyacyl-ACP dehydratase FabZ [Candidatus Nitrospinota bacterium M3_3B_026]